MKIIRGLGEKIIRARIRINKKYIMRKHVFSSGTFGALSGYVAHIIVGGGVLNIWWWVIIIPTTILYVYIYHFLCKEDYD